LTSQLRNDITVISNSDLKNGTLKNKSLVVVPKNFTLHNSILFKYIGSLKSKKLDEIFNCFVKK